MKKNFKKLFAGLLVTSAFTMFNMNANALSTYDEATGLKEYYVDNDIYTCKNTFGDVYLPSNLKYANIEISLFCEFTNPKDTLDVVNEKYKNDILSISNEYNLSYPITNDNYKEYNEKIENNNGEYNELSHFLSLYGSKDDNADIANSLSMIKSLDPNNNETDELILNVKSDFNTKLPMYSTKIIDYNTFQNRAQTFATRKGLDVSKAVTYAKNYAENPNTSKYRYFDGDGLGDCTNFVSQILYEGGVGQIPGINASFGWWHIKVGSAHKHSKSWSSAPAFYNYWGYNLGTNNFENFSKNVQKGDVILIDFYDRGSVNHAGFVTATTTTQKTFTKNNGTTVKYYDFEIAQHTDNYIGYVSGRANGWLKHTNDNANYFISRFH